jgi:murein L,D-transpeptidase YcbB/YkuD
VKRFFFALLLFFFAQFVAAQSLTGDKGVLGSSRSYRKVSGDTLRLRPSVVEKMEKEEKRKARAEAKAAKEKAKANTPRVKKSPIDSVRYAPHRYTLGERVIMRGDSGHDVLSVAKILVKKLYLDEADIIYTPDGGAVYDGAMVKAVLLFQKFNDFYEDGIIGRELIKALRKRK